MSVFDDLVDPVDHARNMTTELKEERPQHLEAWTVLDEDGQERRKRHRMTRRTLTIQEPALPEGVSVIGEAVGDSGEQVSGPLQSGRDVGAGGIECFVEQLPSPLQPSGNVRPGCVEGLSGYFEGALIRVTQVRRSGRHPGPRGLGRHLVGFSRSVQRGCVRSAGCDPGRLLSSPSGLLSRIHSPGDRFVRVPIGHGMSM
jgi:hypothetical protein